MPSRTILVTGATGKQGGATARALLKQRGTWRLRALVRDPSSKGAEDLGALGIELVRGDLSDVEAVRSAVRGAYGVYSVQTPMGRDGVAGEERQGKLLATEAARAGVQHFVYSSVAGAERRSGVPHFESKWRIEEHVRASGLPATILRPVAFMDNFDTFAFRTVMLAMTKRFVDDSKPVQFVAVRDIGWFAAEAFRDPSGYVDRAIELAGDAATRPRLVEILRRAGRTPVVPFRMPDLLLGRMPADFTIMMRWIGERGFEADLDELRGINPKLMTLQEWAIAS